MTLAGFVLSFKHFEKERKSVKSFFKLIIFLTLTSFLLLLLSTPFIYKQVYDVVFNLNLEKNREQGERLATLASIDLENGVPAAAVLAKIQNMLETTPQSSEHFACIVEHENRVIAHPKPSNINKDVTGWTLHNQNEKKTYTQSAGEGIPFGGIQTRNDGSQDITYQIPISTQPWSVAVHTKLDLVEQQTISLLTSIAKIVLPVVFLIVVISAFIISKNELRRLD